MRYGTDPPAEVVASSGVHAEKHEGDSANINQEGYACREGSFSPAAKAFEEKCCRCARGEGYLQQ